MLTNSFLRNIVFTKPQISVESVPVDNSRLSDKVTANKIIPKEENLSNSSEDFYQFAEMKDITSKLSPNNPSLYKVFADEYIPNFFQLSANNQSMLKDEFRILLEDLIPLKHYRLDEHVYVAIEAALYERIKSNKELSKKSDDYNNDPDLNSDKLILSRIKSELSLLGIENFPILTVYLVKNALDSSLNLAILINQDLKELKDQEKLIEQEDSDQKKLSINKYFQLKNNIELDLILRNISDFIKKLDTLTAIPDEYNQHDISSFIRNQNSINTSLFTLLFYLPRDNEAFNQTISDRKKQVQALLNSDKLDFSAKELLLNQDLFPELELSFDKEIDFDMNTFVRNPSAYLKQYFNTIEKYMKNVSIDNQRRIYNTLKSLYAESHLILDKNTRFRFFAAIVNVTPLALNELINKADTNNENYRFFQVLSSNVLDDLIKSNDQNDLMITKNLVSYFSNFPDKFLQKKVLDLATKLINVDANSNKSMKSSIEEFFQKLLEQKMDPDLKTNLLNLMSN